MKKAKGKCLLSTCPRSNHTIACLLLGFQTSKPYISSQNIKEETLESDEESSQDDSENDNDDKEERKIDFVGKNKFNALAIE